MSIIASNMSRKLQMQMNSTSNMLTEFQDYRKY